MVLVFTSDWLRKFRIKSQSGVSNANTKQAQITFDVTQMKTAIMKDEILYLDTFGWTFLAFLAVVRLACFPVLCGGTPLVLAFIGFHSAHDL